MIFIFDKNHALGSQYIRLYILNKGDDDYYDILALRLLFSSFALMFEDGSFVDMTQAGAVVSKVLSAVPIVLMVLPIVLATTFPNRFQTFPLGMALGRTASVFFKETIAVVRHPPPRSGDSSEGCGTHVTQSLSSSQKTSTYFSSKSKKLKHTSAPR